MHKTNHRAHTRGIVLINNNTCSAPEGRNNASSKPTHDQMLLLRSEKFRRCDEYRHDQTRQRRFERSFESRDLVESEAAIEGEGLTVDTFSLFAGHGAALYGHRPFSLFAPSDITMFTLDLAFWEESFRRAGLHKMLLVLRAMAYGATAEEIGMPARTFRRYMKKVENILAADQ